MMFDPNDPRLTAYLLGELDPAEHAEFESMLQDSPEGRQAADEIRLTVALLSRQLHEEHAAQSQVVRLNHQPIAATPPSSAVVRRPWWRRKPFQLGGLAALLLLGATISLMTITRRTGIEPSRLKQVEIAANTTPVVATKEVLTESAALEPGGANFAFADGSVRFDKLADLAARPEPSGLASAPAGGASAPAARTALALARSSFGTNPPARRAKKAPAASPTQQRGATLAIGDGSVAAGRVPAQAQPERFSRSLGRQPQTFALMSEGLSQQNALAKGSVPAPPSQAAAAQLAQRLQQAPGTPAVQYENLPPTPGDRPIRYSEPPPATPPPATQVPSLQKEARQLAEAAPASGPQTVKEKILEAEKQVDVAAIAVEAENKDQGEVFAPIVDNPFVSVSQDRQSTFSIDVDTASYSNVRRFLTQNMLPPKDAVRIEELLNYFPYNDPPPPPSSDQPFAVHVELAGCPWNAAHRLARIGIAAQPIDQSRRPPSNLVFLVDVSGSMDAENKLPLVQWGLQRLVEQLGENDRVAIVVYASASGLFLPSTSCIKKVEILAAIEQLRAGGSTNGGAGIQIAYDVATQHFIKNGTNRVILATDGDFNVGITNDDELVRLIQAKAKSGVFLSVLGFGMGNLKDAKLEKLADKGNGHYAYIDSPREAYKVLVEEMGSTLVTVAKDVKIQVDFNPAKVSQFRLIGYENRVMAHQDFNDDTKDAGEIGAGHHVTALYQIVPPGKDSKSKAADLSSAVDRKPILDTGSGPELFTVKLRYKRPNEDISRLINQPAMDGGLEFARASDDLKLAAAVAGFGMMLRDSPYKGTLTYAGLLEIAQPTLARDPSGYRKEFVEMVRKAPSLAAPVP